MQHHQTGKEQLSEIGRFLIVGVLATLFDYATFCLFDALLFPLLPVTGKVWEMLFLILSTAFGFTVGLLLNWLLSVSFVFVSVKQNPKLRSRKAFWLFTAIAIVGLALTEMGIVALVALLPDIRLLGRITLFGTAWKKWIAKIVMTCIVLVWNYVARKKLVFRL